MGNKYYTPSIEEFHIGFEYEWLDEDNNWNIATPDEITKEGFENQTYGIRVKYLNKEDIESLGFVLYKEYNNYYSTEEFFYGDFIKKVDEDKFYILRYTISGVYKNVDTSDKETIIGWQPRVSISIRDKNLEKTKYTYCEIPIFSNGIVNNKSELKKIFEQLNLIDNDDELSWMKKWFNGEK